MAQHWKWKPARHVRPPVEGEAIVVGAGLGLMLMVALVALVAVMAVMAVMGAVMAVISVTAVAVAAVAEAAAVAAAVVVVVVMAVAVGPGLSQARALSPPVPEQWHSSGAWDLRMLPSFQTP